MTLSHIQDIINKRAEKKLSDDLDEIKNLIDRNRLLRNLIVSGENGKKDTLVRHFFWEDDERLRGKIKTEWAEIYQQEESVIFLQKVENLQNEIDELKGF